MVLLAWVFGILGGLSAVMGIITALGVLPVFAGSFTETFWMLLAGVFLLITIAAAVSRGQYE